MNRNLQATAAILLGLNLATAACAKDLTFHAEDTSGNSVTITRLAPETTQATELSQLSMFQRFTKVLMDISPWPVLSLTAAPIPRVAEKNEGLPVQAVNDLSSLSCTVSVAGSGRIKDIAINLKANAPLIATASLQAMTEGRSQMDFTIDQSVQLKAGARGTYVVARTNLAQDAKLSGSVKVNGAVFKCD